MEGLRANFGSALHITFNRYNNDELQAFGLAGSHQAMELLAEGSGCLIWNRLALWESIEVRQWLRWYATH